MRKTTTPTLRILRAVLLVGLIGLIALVVALYRFGRAGLPSQTAPSAAPEEVEEAAVMSGEGFDYRITEGERQLGRIRAARVISRAEHEVTLERLDPLEVYRDDGGMYRIYSDVGTYNFRSRATTLSGNVRVEGPNGLELFTQGLTMNRRERVTSDATVHFRMAGEFVGRARSLTANLNRELFTLSGRVEIDSTSPEREPVRLTTQRLTYEREKFLLRAIGDVDFYQGASSLSAPQMQFHLTEDEQSVRFVSAQKGVAGRFVEIIGVVRRQLEMAGDELAVVLDPASGDPLEGELRGGGARPAALWSTDEASQVRLLRAPILHATFTDGELSYAEAYDGVDLREYLAFAPEHFLNWGCGDRAEFNFTPDGTIRDATFHERVEFRNRQALARGDRVDMVGEPYEITMTGDPARMIGVQGELNAPKIVQQGEDGPVRALGGVRGLFHQDRGEATVSVGGAEGPVRLESTRAVWHRDAQSFSFVQNVRLWQGENLLLAQEVETQTEADKILARGGVKTVLVPDEESEGGTDDGAEPAAGAGDVTAGGEQIAEDGAEEPNAAADGESELSREPIEITSEWMEYGLATRRILYHERVQITQIGRVLTCDLAEAQMLEGGGMEWLDCQGNALIKDNVAGRTVRGEDAFFEVGRGEVTFTGTPVVMTGEKGERIEGATLIYDLGSGGTRIAGPQGSPRPAVAEEGGAQPRRPRP